MRTKALTENALSVVLRALYKPNRLVCMVALQTGLRVSDVLRIKTEQLQQKKFTVKETKTGKRKQVRLSGWLRVELLKQAGNIYVFENRLSQEKHRQRQTVWKDLNRVARLYGIKKLQGLGTHSMRKTYAVDLKRNGFTVTQIQKALNHSDPTVTAIYAIADEIDMK